MVCRTVVVVVPQISSVASFIDSPSSWHSLSAAFGLTFHIPPTLRLPFNLPHHPPHTESFLANMMRSFTTCMPPSYRSYWSVPSPFINRFGEAREYWLKEVKYPSHISLQAQILLELLCIAGTTTCSGTSSASVAYKRPIETLSLATSYRICVGRLETQVYWNRAFSAKPGWKA